MFAVGTLFSGSRAAQISVVLIAFLLFYFSSHAVRVRKLLLFGALVVLVGGVTAFNRISALDPYGTFQYRVDLLSNSAEVIAENPVFGTPDYRDHPSMERSRQGQGIIDVVNAYLSVILRHGTAGLALFVIPLWLAMRRLSSYRWRLGETGDPNEEYFVRLLLALMISYAFALATVSMVDRLSIYYWILIVVGAGVGARTAVPESVAEKPTSGPARRGVSVHDYAR